MKHLTKILALSACAVLAITGFAGCNGDGGRGNWDGTVDTSKDGSAYDAAEDENVKSISIFKNDWDQFNTAIKGNSPIYKKIKDKIGVELECLNTGGKFEAQLSIMQAEGDLPDIFLTNGPDNVEFFDRLIRNGDILPITDWVNEEHYPNIYNHLKKYEYLRYNLTYGQGKAWFIPSTWHNEKSLYVRQDWVDNLNKKLDDCLVKEGVVASVSEITPAIREEWQYKAPTNLLEFYRLARAFTLYDPDGNGQNDTCGYISESNKDMDAWVYAAFGASWNEFMLNEETGEYIHGDVSDNAKYATQFVTRLITEGYMSVDSLNGDVGGKQDKFSAGNAGMMYAHNWLNVIVSNILSVNKGLTVEEATAKVTLVAPPVGKDNTFYTKISGGFWQGFCINANSSKARIRKCLELYDYLLSDEGYDILQYGIEGEHYTVENDKRVSTLEVGTDGIIKGLQSCDTASMLYALVDWTMHYRITNGTNSEIICPRQTESEALFEPADYPWLQTTAVVEKLDSCHDLFLEEISVLEKNEGSRYYKAQDSNYNPKTFGWDDLYKTTTNFDKHWKTFVDRYMSAGGTAMFQEYNDYIASGKALKVEHKI